MTDTYCRVYAPVCYSRKDTEQTVNEIVENEVVFTRLCPREAEAGVRRCETQKNK